VSFSVREVDLREKFYRARRLLPADGGLWLAWPKQASRVATDVTFDAVRQIGLEGGLVDNKVCAIDRTWSALRFVVPVATRATWR